jgi:hypothetical protein
MLSDIVEVRYLEAYRLFLRFSDGSAGELDLQPLLDFTGVFAPLRDPKYFAQVRVEPDTGTIVWPSGADLDPDVLRHAMTGEPLPGQKSTTQRAG